MSITEKLAAALRALKNPNNFRSDPTTDTLRARDEALNKAHAALAEFDTLAAEPKTFTVFCRESSGEGTIYISSGIAATWQDAAVGVLAQCADAWEMSPDEIDVIGVAEGDVTIIAWDDEPASNGVNIDN
jgi:hypothetical protein